MRQAKTGIGVEDILEAVIARIPPPKGDPDAPLKALIIDSWFDNYVGVVMLVRVFDGVLRPKDKLFFMASGTQQLCEQVGVFSPKSVPRDALRAGEVGFVIAGIKELKAAKVGDTITKLTARRPKPLPGFKEIKPQVFAGLYPVESNQYDSLRESLEKLKLNDASLAIRAGSLAGAWFRLPLRLPRSVAHGNRAGTAGARVRSGSDHHGADRGL